MITSIFHEPYVTEKKSKKSSISLVDTRTNGLINVILNRDHRDIMRFFPWFSFILDLDLVLWRILSTSRCA